MISQRFRPADTSFEPKIGECLSADLHSAERGSDEAYRAAAEPAAGRHARLLLPLNLAYPVTAIIRIHTRTPAWVETYDGTSSLAPAVPPGQVWRAAPALGDA